MGSALCLTVFTLSAQVVLAKPQAVVSGGKTYHIVTATDPAMDTGNEVCKAVGKTCVGYTAFNTNACKKAHPDAATKSDMNGSKAGFYCDGAPQGGVCANEKNTCHICTNCNVGVTCDESIGGLYREMYVECSPQDEVSEEPSKLTGVWKNFWDIPGRWWGYMRSTVQRSFDNYRDILSRLTIKSIKHGKVKIGNVEADIPADSLVCEFYQTNKKLVTCGALAAADQFCVQAFDSRFAKAELCQDNGVIVCSKPCTTNPQELKPQRCAFDADRPRGNQAPPIDLCTETKTIKVNMNMGTKKAGQQCAHGGECATGYCLGQTSDSGIKYFCSCKQTTLDFTCGK